MFVYDLGLIDYNKAFFLQERAIRTVLQGGEDMLFLLEHPPTVSLGRNQGKKVLPTDFALDQVNATVVRSTRGGDITCHFPGQLVAYPIMNLHKRKTGVRQFVFDLEEVIIRLLAGMGLEAMRRTGYPGVWRGMSKIGSLGIAVKHHVTMHGLSINVDRNMPLFEAIPPCGLKGIQAVSIAGELGLPMLDMQRIKNSFLQAFQGVFFSSMSVSDIEQIHGLDQLCEDLEFETNGQDRKVLCMN